MTTPEETVLAVRKWASGSGAHIVPSTLSVSEQIAIPSAFLSPEEFVALIRATDPRIIYLWQNALDLEAEISSALEGAGLMSDSAAAPAVRRAAGKLRQYEGATARVFVEAVIAGVHHVTYTETAWIERFEEEVEAIAARHLEAADHELKRLRKESSAAVRRLASALVANSAFHSGRVSFAKRRFLAGELFPDEDDRTLDEVVELAENMAWLQSARSE